MSAQTLTTTTAATLASLDDAAARARTFAAESVAPNTRRAYRAAWAHFTGWCESHRLVSLPAVPQTVGLYLAAAAESAAVATLELRLAAIRTAHRVAGEHLDLSHPAVRDVWRGIRRSKGTAQRQAQPLLTLDVLSMLARLPDSLLGKRDRALLLLGFAAGLRRSELVGLDVADLTFNPDGLTLRVRRSKTDQEGAGQVVGVVNGQSAATCPVQAVREWLAAAGVEEGPVFRIVNRHGQVGGRLSGQAVGLVLKRWAEAAGLDPATVSGHSLRAGCATQAAAGGASAFTIKRTTRHASLNTLDRYIRNASVMSDTASAYLGL